MIAWEERAVFLACIVFGAVLATLLMGSGCAARQAGHGGFDGEQRERMDCEQEADVSEHPGEAYDLCMARRGL